MNKYINCIVQIGSTAICGIGMILVLRGAFDKSWPIVVIGATVVFVAESLFWTVVIRIALDELIAAIAQSHSTGAKPLAEARRSGD